MVEPYEVHQQTQDLTRLDLVTRLMMAYMHNTDRHCFSCLVGLAHRAYLPKQSADREGTGWCIRACLTWITVCSMGTGGLL